MGSSSRAAAAGATGGGCPRDRPWSMPRRPRQPWRTAARMSRARRRGCTCPAGRTAGLHPSSEPYRHPWANPILWRELMTRAYGAKPLIIKGCYVLLFALGMGLFFYEGHGLENPLRSTLGLIPIGLTILSLILVNAQGVTALTSERDTGALDLLLVSELTPKEFIYGKLYGILYNSKEMIALPVLTAVAMWVMGILSGENLVLFVIDFLLLCHFSAMLGLHSAITYTSSQTGRGQQPRHDLLLDGRDLALLLPDRAQQAGVRPPAPLLHDLHRCRQRGAVRIAGGQEPVPRHRLGLALDAVLDVLLHYQPGARRYHGGVPGERGPVRLRHTRDAGSSRRRFRHRAGTHQRDPGLMPSGRHELATCRKAW